MEYSPTSIASSFTAFLYETQAQSSLHHNDAFWTSHYNSFLALPTSVIPLSIVALRFPLIFPYPPHSRRGQCQSSLRMCQFLHFEHVPQQFIPLLCNFFINIFDYSPLGDLCIYYPLFSSNFQNCFCCCCCCCCYCCYCCCCCSLCVCVFFLNYAVVQIQTLDYLVGGREC